MTTDRQALARRGKRLEYFTIAWNSIEGLIAVIAGMVAGSISLVGFGVDSFIEVTSGSALLWRMSLDADAHRREDIERRTLRIVGGCFLPWPRMSPTRLCSIWQSRKPPRTACRAFSSPASPGGDAAAVAGEAASRHRDEQPGHARRCSPDRVLPYLSAILLGGLLLNSLLGWWWADPVAALAMVPIIAKEGIDGLRGDACCD
jgi:hypothetical protein